MIDHTGVAVSGFAASQAFYEAALGAIGHARLMAFPNYHGAFVHDPDGHDIEAVCHAPEEHS